MLSKTPEMIGKRTENRAWEKDVYKRQDIFSKTKLLLSVYRDVVWITLSESACVNEELVYYGEEPVSYTHLETARGIQGFNA